MVSDYSSPPKVRTYLKSPERPARESYSIGFLLFPLLISTRLTPALEVASLGLLLMVSLIGKPTPMRWSQYVPTALIGLCAALSLLRGGSILAAIYLLLVITAAFLAGRRTDVPTAVRSLVAGLVLYMSANVIGWLAGLQSPSARVRVGLFDNPDSLLGVRVLFPFVRSINEPAIVAVAFIVYALVAKRMGSPWPRWYWPGLLLSAFMIVASGSRFPVIVLLAVGAAALIQPRTARLLPNLALVSVALPYAYTALAGTISWVADRLSVVSFISRGQTASELASGSSRAGFWETGLGLWSSATSTEQLIGYGYNGHVQSRVVYYYYTRSSDSFVSDPSALTLHNSYLQQMYDTGYVGLAALVVALWIVGRRFSRVENWPVCAVIGVLIGTSMVEIYLVPTAQAIPILLLVALSAVVMPKPSTDVAGGVRTFETSGP